MGTIFLVYDIGEVTALHAIDSVQTPVTGINNRGQAVKAEKLEGQVVKGTLQLEKVKGQES